MKEIKQLLEISKQILALKRKYVRQRKIVGKAIQKKRIEAGHSYRKTAKILGISAPYLSDIEKGNRGLPTTGRQTKLLKALKLL